MADINNNIQINVLTNILQVKVEAEKAKKAYSELKANVEAAAAAANLLAGALKTVGISGKGIDDMKKSLSDIVSTVESLSTAVTVLQKRKAEAAASTAKLTVAQRALGIAMKALPIFAIISAIGSLISGISSLVSWLWGETDACKAATEALEKYNEVVQQTQGKVRQLSEEEASVTRLLKEEHERELLELQKRGATAVELSEVELRQQQELADVTIEASQKREEQLNKEQEASKEAIAKQAAYVADLEARAEKSLQSTLDLIGVKRSSYNTEQQYLEATAKLRKEAYEKTEEERKKLEELTAQQQSLNNKLLDEVSIRAGAANAVLGKSIGLDSANKNQSQDEKNKADEQNKKYAAVAKQSIQQKKALDIAMLKAEKAYLSEDFATKQEYASKLFKAEEDAAKALLSLRMNSGELSKKEYEKECQLLQAQRTQFENKQQQDEAKHAQQLLSQLQNHQKKMAKMVADEFQQQRIDITEEYQNTVKDIEALMKMVPKDSPEYKKLADDIVTARQTMSEDLKAIDAKENEHKLAALDKEYEKELQKLANNKAAQLELEREHLEKVKQLKLAANPNADTASEDAALATNSEAAKLAAIQAGAAEQLAAENLTAKKRYQIKQAALQKELELLRENGKAGTQEFLAKELELDELDKSFQEQRFERIMEFAEKSKEVMSGIFELGNAQDEAKLQRAAEQSEQEKQQLQAQLDANLISKDEYNRKVKQSDDQLAKEQAKIKRKQAIQDKASALFETGINTAMSIVASAKAGFPAAIPFVIMAAALGAVQTAAILATPLPKAARGMYIKGQSHAMGGVQLEAEGGEMVINKRSSSMFAPLLSAINEAGGGIPFVSSYADGGFAMRDYQRTGTQGITTEAIAGAVREAVQEVKIYTAIEDINDGNKKYAAVTDSSKF